MLQWIKHDLATRTEHLADLLKSIRLTLLSVEELIEQIECEPLVMANAECNRILHLVSQISVLKYKDFKMISGYFKRSY